MKKVYIETMGCQMNKSDTERMLGMLSYLDYEETKNPEQADLLIVNTCSIRQLSEDKAFSQLGVWGKWKQEKPALKIGIAGCVAQQKAQSIFKRAHYVDFVLGTHKIYALPEIIEKINRGEKVCECTETNSTEDDLAVKYDIKRVILFGSRARGDYQRASDIDLAVEGGRITDFILEVKETTSTLLNFDIVDLEKTAPGKFRDSIKKEGIILYEKI